MATQADVRRIAMQLPGVSEEPGRFAFHVGPPGKQKHFVWVWLERIAPKKARVPNPGVIAIRVANELEKQALLSADETTFFTEPHYDGYPAVMVNLDRVTAAELEPLLREAWRCRAPKHLLEGTAPPRARTSATARPTSKRKRTSKPDASSKPDATSSSSRKTSSRPRSSSRSKSSSKTTRTSKPTSKTTRTSKPPRER